MSRLIVLSLLSLGLAGGSALAAQAGAQTEKAATPAARPAQPPAAPLPARPPVPPPQPGVSQPAPPPPEVTPPEQVIARIGSQEIHEKDFEDMLRALAGPRRLEQMSRAPGGLARFRQQFLDSQVLAAKARKEGLQQLPEFKEEMKIQEDQVLVKLLMGEERAGSEGQRLKEKIDNPSEEEIKAFFERNAQRYDTPEKFTARHILVGLKGSPRMGDKGLTEEEAKARIAKIQAELAAGKKFEDLAKEYSDDPSNKASGGLIKDATFGSFVKEFEEAVRTQEIGKVGGPVKTVFGYHLIVVDSRTPKQPAVYEQVRERVKQQMIPERRQAVYREFIDQVQKEMGFVAVPTKPAAPAAANPPAGATPPAPAAKPSVKQEPKKP